MEADQPSQPQGKVAGLLNAVKGLTFTNALIIIMLAVVAAPAYFTWRLLNEPALLDRFMSHYRELSAQQSNCGVREAQLRNSAQAWAISTGFAYQGSDRWLVSVVLDRQPDADDLVSYCATLNLIVDYMRDPASRSPNFPGTEEPVIRTYERTP